MKMKDLFKSGDFMHRIHDERTCEKIAHMANEKLNALIEQAPIIATQDGNPYIWKMCAGSMDGVMEVARLMFVEDYIPKSCKHEPEKKWLTDIGNMQTYIVCKHCGIELIADWKAK